jgi:hypothetical protein
MEEKKIRDLRSEIENLKSELTSPLASAAPGIPPV